MKQLPSGLYVPDYKISNPAQDLDSTLFTAGIWNTGGDGKSRFTPAVRTAPEFLDKLKIIKDSGCDGIELHSTDEPQGMARREIKEAIEAAGLKVVMVTANLFSGRKEYVNGNLGHHDEKVRQLAIEDTLEYYRSGVDMYGASVYVYWNGSSGFNVRGTLYGPYIRRIAESLTRIAERIIEEFGWEKAIPIAIEPKFNEPVIAGCPADFGQVLALISLIPPEYRDLFGVNIESAHAQMAGQNPAAEFSIAYTVGRLYYVHLNAQGGAGHPMAYDRDLAFGDDFEAGVEQVLTLRRMGWMKERPVAFDVQPLISDQDPGASIRRSVQNFRAFHNMVVNRWDYEKHEQLLQENRIAEAQVLWTQFLAG